MASQASVIWDMLATGMTDKEIAHELRLHDFTVRRTMVKLMKEHGVTNRIALAIKHPRFATCGQSSAATLPIQKATSISPN